MSTYYVVHLRTSVAPEMHAEAHAADALFLNARGRPCSAARAAWLESQGLAQALLDACGEPLAVRHGEVNMSIRQLEDDGEGAERIAADSDATRQWLASQPSA